MSITQDEKHMLMQELVELKQEHRELDLAITNLQARLDTNQFEVSRLKKQKLKLKDAIARLESNLIPDLLA
ncbi:MAG: DUF465 domain-containing protein [Arenicella sp.]|nr:DUF465 domain-containing protein [Arenicella sp.]